MSTSRQKNYRKSQTRLTQFRTDTWSWAKKKSKKIKTNIWYYSPGFNKSTKDKIAFEHPAIFPEALARDHIISWSNENDMVLDCFCGSGTTLKMCEQLNRKWMGIEIEERYCEIAAKRIEQERKQLKLF